MRKKSYFTSSKYHNLYIALSKTHRGLEVLDPLIGVAAEVSQTKTKEPSKASSGHSPSFLAL